MTTWPYGSHARLYWQRYGVNVIPEEGTHPLWYELAAYLGDDFDPALCHGEDAAVNAEAAQYTDSVTFYRDTRRYLYHLIAYYLERWKQPAYAWVWLFAKQQDLTILDYGCGIGCDGLTFLEAGLKVSFADVRSQSIDYLRWRLQRRMYHAAQVYELPAQAPPKHQIVWCMDTLEHLPSGEQAAFIDGLATLGELVILNLVDDRQADGVVHHPVDIEALTAHIRDQWSHVYTDWYVRDDGGKTRFICFGALLPELMARYIDLTIHVHENNGREEE